MREKNEELEKLKELLKEDNALSLELNQHYNDETFQHRINELHEKVIHLQEAHREKNLSDEERKRRSLEGHLRAVHAATEEWHHLAHGLMHIIEAKELYERREQLRTLEAKELNEIREKLRHLIEEVEREKNELARTEAKKQEALHLREK